MGSPGFEEYLESKTLAKPVAVITVTPIAGALGAEIGGVDLNALDDETTAEIRAAWLRHLVVFFRDQDLGSDAFVAFARRVGEPIEYPFVAASTTIRRSSRSRSCRTRPSTSAASGTPTPSTSISRRWARC